MVRRSLDLTVRLVGWTLASLVVLGALLVWRLSAGPLSLEVLTPYLERALSSERALVTTTVEATELRIGREDGIALVALGVIARDADDRVLFDLPEVEVELSTRALLLHQELAPSRLRARSPSVVLVRRPDGSIGLRGARTGAGGGRLDLRLMAGAMLSEPDPDRPLSFIELVEIEGATVVLEDQASGLRIEGSRGTLSAIREAGALAARATIRVERAGRTLGVSALARLDPEQGLIDAALDLERARPVDLRLVQDLLPVQVRQALEQVPLETLDAALGGRLAVRSDLAGELRAGTFRLASDGGRLEWPEQLERPLDLSRLTLTGSFDPATGSTTISRLEVLANGATIRAAGSGRLTPEGPVIQARASARNVQVEQLRALWPVRAADEAREWVVENMQAGRAPEGRVLIDIQPGDLEQRPLRKEALRGSFTFEDLTIRYFKTLPVVEGVDGAATFDGQTMSFDAAGGRVGALRADSATVTITGIGIKGRESTQLQVETRITGPIPDALALIDRPPFRFASKLKIEPQAASGSARTLLRVGLPLHRDIEEDEVRIAAEATLRDAAIAGLFGRADLDGGAFELDVDRRAMTLQGRARFAGTPVEVEWEEVFEGQDYDRRLTVEGMVDPEALRAFGIDQLPVEFDGAARTRLGVVGTGDRIAVDADLELETARLAYAPLAWRKPLGEAARLEARLQIEDGAVVLERFDFDSAGLRASGAGSFGLAPFEVRAVDVRRFAYGEQDLGGRVRRGDDGTLEITLNAQRLDLRPFLGSDDDETAQPEGTVGEPGPPLRLQVAAREVLFAESGRLQGLEGSLARGRREWLAADLEAALASGRPVRLSLQPAGPVRRLVVESEDAGALFEAFGQTRQIQGGRLRLEADLEAQHPALIAQGQLAIHDFTLKGAPVLARLLTVASLTGIGNLLQGEGIFVDRLALPFRLQGDALRLRDGRLTGSQLGLTVEGAIDLAVRRVDLDGTVVPVYALNRAIGAIPVIGDFLAGSEGEGAFAMSYRLRGPFENPSVSVNPLSAITPGFLRDLFTGLREGTLEPPKLPPDRD